MISQTDDPDLPMEFNAEPDLFVHHPANYAIHFQHDSGEVGRLEFTEDGTLKFEGKTEESAQVFFDHVISLNNKTLDDAKKLLAAAACPECKDKSGAYAIEVPGYDGEGDLELVQCQWCTEVNALLGKEDGDG